MNVILLKFSSSYISSILAIHNHKNKLIFECKLKNIQHIVLIIPFSNWFITLASEKTLNEDVNNIRNHTKSLITPKNSILHPQPKYTFRLSFPIYSIPKQSIIRSVSEFQVGHYFHTFSLFFGNNSIASKLIILLNLSNSVFRSSHRRCSIKKLILKILHIHKKTLVLESLFDKDTGLKAWNF